MQATAYDNKGGGSGERVHALLLEQRDLYRQLAGLAERQRALITGGQPEQLLAGLADRQRLVDRLTVTGNELKPYQANWRQFREGLAPDEATRIDRLVGEVNVLLSRILEKDAADAALLSARKSETGQAIGQLHAGRQAGAAYANSAPASSGMDWAQA